MSAATQASQTPHRLLADFAQCRANTDAICARLEIEDHVVQPAPFVSPPKWHLAHTTWFFDCFLLGSRHSTTLDPGFRRGDEGKRRGDEDNVRTPPSFDFLFNSYYKTLGGHWLQERRGQLSRPTVREIHEYRRAVTESVLRSLERGEFSPQQLELLELGIHHEQQHQELLLMDIKYILGTHPEMPAYDEVLRLPSRRGAFASPQWLDFAAGLRQIGHAGDGFAFDNESPRHRVWLDAFSLRDQLVRNGEYLAFIRDGGYQRPEFWLSDGWDWLNTNRITAPLYWHNAHAASSSPRRMPGSSVVEGRQPGRKPQTDSDAWFEYHLGGLQPLDPALPVSHVSYYEAAAFASWAGARLPSEAELEVASEQLSMHGKSGADFVQHAPPASPPHMSTVPNTRAFWNPGAPVVPDISRAADSLENGLLWQWCRNAYEAYPGYARSPDALGEYNGKFMSGRQVLRGGCVATPAGHWRATYRNFYRPEDRWCFTGIRLARDVK